MAGPRNRKKCKNCPQPVSTVLPPADPPAPPTRVLAINSESEGRYLWNHVIFGTGTCVGMMEGYHALGMPGDPLKGITELRDRLNALICQLTKEPSNADQPPAE